MREMERSWLVQRLNKPCAGRGGEVFSFGGGLMNGGLSKEAMELIRPIFSFDYMGASEFEWGAVPKAFQRVAQSRNELVAFSYSVSTSDIEISDYEKEYFYGEIPSEQREIYVLCPADMREEVERRIRLWAISDRGEEFEVRTKERVYLKESLLSRYARPDRNYGRPEGWIELDNGFMFFLDEQMFARTILLFSEDESEVRKKAGALAPSILKYKV